MSKRQIFADQRGVAMLFELILLAVVIAAFAVVGVRSYQSRKAASTTPAMKKSTIANGNPDNAVNAILDSATVESSLTAKDSTDTAALDATVTAASSLEGGINESSY